MSVTYKAIARRFKKGESMESIAGRYYLTTWLGRCGRRRSLLRVEHAIREVLKRQKRA